LNYTPVFNNFTNNLYTAFLRFAAWLRAHMKPRIQALAAASLTCNLGENYASTHIQIPDWSRRENCDARP